MTKEQAASAMLASLTAIANGQMPVDVIPEPRKGEKATVYADRFGTALVRWIQTEARDAISKAKAAGIT